MIKKEDLKLVNETIKAFKKKHKKSQPIERAPRNTFTGSGSDFAWVGNTGIGRRAGLMTSHEVPPNLIFHPPVDNIETNAVSTSPPDPELFNLDASTYQNWQSQPLPVPSPLSAATLEQAYQDAIVYGSGTIRVTGMNTLVETERAALYGPRSSNAREDLENHIREHTRELARQQFNVPGFNLPGAEFPLTVSAVDQANRTVTVTDSRPGSIEWVETPVRPLDNNQEHIVNHVNALQNFMTSNVNFRWPVGVNEDEE